MDNIKIEPKIKKIINEIDKKICKYTTKIVFGKCTQFVNTSKTYCLLTYKIKLPNKLQLVRAVYQILF